MVVNRLKEILTTTNQFHDKDSGNLVTNRFVTVKDKTYFIGSDSKAIKGATVIDNTEYFFDEENWSPS